MSGRLRLHISPLNSSLLATLIPPAILSTANNISYHTLETFSERDYGYVELPRVEAEKMKKKYNGSILKGAKVRIEEAREEKIRAKGDSDPPGVEERKSKRVKTASREDGVLPGHELASGRQVQRGWTKPGPAAKPDNEPKSKKEKPHTSLYTAKAECLFKTKLPANVAAANISASLVSKAKPEKRKRKDSHSKQVIVHEFSNTTKQPSFLRDDLTGKATGVVSEFIDGKGWVDEGGNVIEDVRTTQVRGRKAAGELNAKAVAEKAKRSESESDSGDNSKSPNPRPVMMDHTRQNLSDETSSSGSSSESGMSEDDQDSVHSVEEDKTLATDTGSTTNGQNTRKDIHPLEVIFKRPKQKSSPETPKPSLKVSTSFNFFEPDVTDGPSDTPAIPQTPFTQQDFQQRTQRSAAPTPDTAAPGKTFSHVWPVADEEADWGSDDDVEDNDAQTATPVPERGAEASLSDAKAPDAPPSDFAKWFWEHRGETNRAWKKRRREAAKEKRHRENRRHGRSAA
ncbi:hypothetical protein MMC16_006401 [Acarospora aff. strigata]|nr:hypothetical protein [Acarospora aff. strigata]